MLSFYAREYPRDPQFWPKRVAAGAISLNGQVVQECKARVCRGDTLEYFRKPWVEPLVDLTLDVVHESATEVIVNKRPGLPVLPTGNFLEHTVLHLVRNAGWKTAVPAHRLGRGTSGLLVFALTAEGRSGWARRFREHGQVHKVYTAVLQGRVEWDELTVAVAIGVTSNGVFGAVQEGGKESLSHFTCVKRAAQASVVRVRIVTGRPHQILSLIHI